MKHRESVGVPRRDSRPVPDQCAHRVVAVVHERTEEQRSKALDIRRVDNGSDADEQVDAVDGARGGGTVEWRSFAPVVGVDRRHAWLVCGLSEVGIVISSLLHTEY